MTCLNAYVVDGVKRQAVSLPVGSGKTLIFSHLISRLPSPTPAATKTLVLAHREELLEQACRMIEQVSPGLRVAIDQGRSRADPAVADVIVASVPTLGRRDSTRLLNYDPSLFKCIIIDEAHHAAAESYLRIIEHFRALEPNTHLLLWGCSATLSRNDHLALGSVFQKIVYHVDMMRLMREGHLSPLQAVQVDTDIDLSGLEQNSGDFDDDQLSLAIDTPGRNKLVAETWKRVAWEEHGRRSTIVFGLNIRHVENLAQEFHRLGVTAVAVITGLTPEMTRREIIEQYSLGKIGVLLNCAVLTEGTDLPRTDCVLLTRPTCNPNLYIQMVGRGLRRHPEKAFCLLLDVVDRMAGDCKRSLITFPTLLPKYSLSASTSDDDVCEVGEQMEQRAKRAFTDHLMNRIKVKLTQSNLSNPIYDLGGHRIAWLPIDESTLVASEGKMSVLVRLDQPVLEKMSCSVELLTDYGKNRTIFCSPSTPLHVALEAVSRHLAQDPGLLERFSRSAYWRRHPITPNQLRYIVNIASKLRAGDELYREMYSWTVGRASDVLSKYAYLRKQGLVPTAWSELVDGVSSVTFFKRRK